jgi:hypothetical protein
MSEYRCYEFVALDRPLTSKQMEDEEPDYYEESQGSLATPLHGGPRCLR